MVWGAFSADGTLRLAFPSCRMNSNNYQNILEAHLLPLLHRNKQKKLVFQQDNASIHVSTSTIGWFQRNTVEILEWPARSPDLNPIENLWGCLVRAVYKDNRQFSTVLELQTAIIEAWEDICPDLLEKLVNSMENRLFQVACSNGGMTKY